MAHRSAPRSALALAAALGYTTARNDIPVVRALPGLPLNVLQPDQARSGLVDFTHAGHPWQASSGNQIRETRHHTGLRT